MSFLAPQWLWLAVPLTFYLLHRYRKKNLLLNRKTSLILAAMVFVILAMMRPAIAQKPRDITQEGHDVILAIDLSYSMHANDLSPNRLAYAKKLLRELVSANTRDRFGIIGFTTNAIVLSPLSDDSALLLHLFDRLDEELIITKGTAVMPVLKLARKMSQSPDAVVVLLTDGGDNEAYSKEAAFAKAEGLHVSIALLASNQGATITTAQGNVLEDSEGNIVITRANHAIDALAKVSGGSVVQLPQASDIAAILHQSDRYDFKQQQKLVSYTEFFYLFIVLALMAAMAAFTNISQKIMQRLMALLLFFGISANAGILDGYYLRSAHEAYKNQRYLEAAHYYERIAKKAAQFNAANGYYKAGEYEKALLLYATIKSADATFKAAVYFNSANCYIRLKEFAKARDMLMRSLTLVDDAMAKENLLALLGVEEEQRMITKRQKNNTSAPAMPQEKSKNSNHKEGGGANMDVVADAASGSSNKEEKMHGDARLSFSNTKGRLSSRQYELINQRSVHESKPW